MEETLPVAEIPVGFFEYRTTFTQPIFSVWYDGKLALVTEMYKALEPWGVNLDKVSWNAAPKNLEEAQITFNLPSPPVIVNIGIGGVTIVANNADWSQLSSLSALCHAVTNRVASIGNTELKSHQGVVGFHLKPGMKPFRDVMGQFIDTKGLGNEAASMLGVGLYGPDLSLIIDNSVAVQGGVFVKITRTFPATTSFEEMASTLWKDEVGVIGRLGFRTQ